MIKKKNLHIPFAILMFLSLPLTLFIIYTSFLILTNNTKGKVVITESPKKQSIEDIAIPNFDIPRLQFSTDLKKFPPDYESILSSLNISLSQHQKTTLLLYGRTQVKTEYTNITDAYKYLIEKNIPILIPQEYINKYLEDEFSERYLTEGIPEKIKEPLTTKVTNFSNRYEEYLYNQLSLQLQNVTTQQTNEIIDSRINEFLIDINSQSMNDAYYKLRIFKFLEQNIDENIINTLNDLVIYSSNNEDANTKARLSETLKDIVLNNLLNRDGSVYWNISVFGNKTYVYPMYISEEFVVNDNNFNDPYDVEPLTQSRNSVRIPILMYHHIDPMPNSTSKFTLGLYVTPEIFEEQLAYLVKMNYKSITPQELYNLLQDGKNPSQKSVMITFDDSTKGQYTNAYPLLKKYGLVGIYFVTANKSSITYAQLREMGKNGMVIGSHSSTHIDLVKESSGDRLYSEIVDSRYSLRSGTGQEVLFISYPGCVANSKVYSYVGQAGYILGGSCGRSIDHYFKGRLSLSRVHVFNNVQNLKDILSGKP